MTQANMSCNRVLASLSVHDGAILEPRLKPVSLPVRTRLQSERRPIETIYFLDSGIASLVGSSRGRKQAEVGVIGREGMTGHCAVLGVDRSPFEIMMQVSGRGRSITVNDLRAVMDHSHGIREAFALSVYLFSVQTGYTVLANAQATLKERLARWLLMARDRLDDDDMPLTQEYLALMLGVRRAGVTFAIGEFETKGLIGSRRGVIWIQDREALVAAAGGFYGGAEAESERLAR